MLNKTVKKEQSSAADKRKLIRLGKEVDLLFKFEFTFSPYRLLMGRLMQHYSRCASFRKEFSQEDLNQIDLLKEHYTALEVIIAKYRDPNWRPDPEYVRSMMKKIAQ